MNPNESKPEKCAYHFEGCFGAPCTCKKPEQVGGWRVGATNNFAFRDWIIPVYENGRQIFAIRTDSKELAEATAKRIVEDHEGIKAISERFQCKPEHASIVTRTYITTTDGVLNSLRAKLKEAEESNARLSNALTDENVHVARLKVQLSELSAKTEKTVASIP